MGHLSWGNTEPGIEHCIRRGSTYKCPGAGTSLVCSSDRRKDKGAREERTRGLMNVMTLRDRQGSQMPGEPVLTECPRPVPVTVQHFHMG